MINAEELIRLFSECQEREFSRSSRKDIRDLLGRGNIGSTNKFRTYLKGGNGSEFAEINDIDTVKRLLSDDSKNSVSINGDDISVATSWGEVNKGTGKTHKLIKYGPGDYNLVENDVFNKSYQDLGNGRALKKAPVDAIKLTSLNGPNIEKLTKGDYNSKTGTLKTLEGDVKVKPGMMIKRGVKGEHFAQESDAFKKMYKRKR